MKKIIAIALTFTLLFAMSLSVLAEDGSTGGNTNLTYSVAAGYTVTIPASITLSGGTASGAYGVNDRSLLNANKKLQFAITASTNYDSGFRMINDLSNSVFLPYTITKGGAVAVTKDAIFLEVSPAQAYEGKTETLTYTTSTPEAAGTYSDTLTITISQTSITP